MLITTDAAAEDLQQFIRANSVVQTSIRTRLGIKYLVLSPQQQTLNEDAAPPRMFQLKIQNSVLDDAISVAYTVILAAVTATLISALRA